MQRPLKLALLLVLGLAIAPQVAPQQPSENTYQAESTLVVVDAIVTDKKAHPLIDLAAGDFKVYEDGVEQKILSFSQPEAQAPESAPSQPGVAGTSPAGATFPRFLTVVLDLADNKPDNIKRSCEA